MLKTNLDRKIKTKVDAIKFLTDLHNNGEAFHPEDDANDVEFASCNPTAAERRMLNWLMVGCWSVLTDPCEVFLSLARETTFPAHVKDPAERQRHKKAIKAAIKPTPTAKHEQSVEARIKLLSRRLDEATHNIRLETMTIEAIKIELQQLANR